MKAPRLFQLSYTIDELFILQSAYEKTIKDRETAMHGRSRTIIGMETSLFIIWVEKNGQKALKKYYKNKNK